ncbi:dTMP kinase [archaeon]|nr:dTMP kinase [archaeon]|tara:strand:- start:5673 stop:6266 length:594 start_codon:yes stop_codon:yes gene_type:complete
MDNGKFIIIEGIDGSGKSTQCKLIADFLTKQGYEVTLTKEPTDFETGKFIRQVLRGEKGQLPPLEFQKLYVKDREEHLEKIVEPALSKGKIVISDRYFFSTIAYGSIDLPVEDLEQLNSHFRIPDMTIMLDIPIEESLNRINNVRNIEFFENENKLAKVMKTYQTFQEKYPNIHILDGTKSLEKVTEDIKALVTSIL